GLISKGEFDISTNITNGSFTTGTALTAAAVVGVNTGTIEGVKSHSSISRNFNCSTMSAALYFSPYETIATFVGVNNTTGMIKEIQSEGEFKAGFSIGSAYNNCLFSKGDTTTSPFIADNKGSILDFEVKPKYSFMNNASPAPELFAKNTGNVMRGFATFESSDGNKLMNQSHLLVASWDPSVNPFSSNPAIAPQAYCISNDAGKYYDVVTASASTNVGPVNIGDVIMCNGVNNVAIPATIKSGIMNAMTDVLYVVQTPPPTVPTLLPGRYYDNDLEFSLGAGSTGLRVDSISLSGPLFDHPTTWAVGTDFLNPGTSVWTLDLRGGAPFTTKTPELVKTGGGLEQLGPQFPF
ncbi:MAG: hypothetical protein ACXVLQ_19050, partial [Bacteriovorax sp.]